MIQNDDHLLLQDIISYSMRSDNKNIMLELVIRPECNQKCKYCYIVQHGKESYPCRYSNKEILDNLELLIDEFISKDYTIRNLELFAGDLFYDNLFFEIINPIRRYYQFLNNKHKDLLQEWHQAYELKDDFVDPAIIIPCNMSFCEDDEKIEKVKLLCKEFNDELGVKIYFSYSTDGIYALDSREQKDLNEAYFDKIFALCEEMNWGMHPMISYEGIDNAIDNYEWFKMKMRQFRINYGDKIPGYLEVRNDGWTEETLNTFEKFLRYYLSDIFHNEYHSDLELMFHKFFTVFLYHEETKTYELKPGFSGLGQFVITNFPRMPCSIGSYEMCINVGDLSLLPCHRLAYPELRGGQYQITPNGTLELKASEFLNSYLTIYYYNNLYTQACQDCKYNLICLKGCLGAQYEKYADISMSIPSVCKMFEKKYNTMINFYHSIGMFHYLFTKQINYPLNTLFQKVLLSLGYNEYKVYHNLGDFYNVRD